MPIKSPPYDIGDRVILQGDFYDEHDQLSSPTTVALEIKCPDGTTIIPPSGDITFIENGKYEYRYIVNNGYGYYYVTWRGTGVIAISRQKKFPVRVPY